MNTGRTHFKKGTHPSSQTEFRFGSIPWNKGKKIGKVYPSKPCFNCGELMEKPRRFSSKQWVAKKYCGFKCWGYHSPWYKDGRSAGDNKLEYKRVKCNERRARILGAEGTFTAQEWEEVKKKYNYCCAYCLQSEDVVKLTKDHIIPLTKGGSNYITNIQPLCRSCNSSKYNKILNYAK